jgi:hypothetical protein
MQVLDLPVTGPGEEAADELGVFLVAGSVPEEQAVLAGSQLLFQRSHTPDAGCLTAIAGGGGREAWGRRVHLHTA